MAAERGRARSAATRAQAASSVCGERRIKVNQTHYDYKPKGDARPYHLNRAVPWVQLKGYWLEQVGFSIDTRIQVRIMQGCLVLTVLTEPHEE